MLRVYIQELKELVNAEFRCISGAKSTPSISYDDFYSVCASLRFFCYILIVYLVQRHKENVESSRKESVAANNQRLCKVCVWV